MALILSRESASNAAHFSEVLRRLSKRNLQNIQPAYLDIVRFNTALIMNEDVAVQPPTQVTYIPFINLNPANPETTVTPMYKLR